MIAFARWFLWIGGGIFLIAYTGPLLLAPLRWSRFFRWSVPEDSALTVYFARCLGGVGTVIVGTAMIGAASPARLPMVLGLIALTGAMLTAVHAWGAIEQKQPWTETIEVPVLAAMSGLAAWLYLSLM